VASVLEFRIREVDRAVEAARAIGAAAGPGFTTMTWEDENRALFHALHLEKLVTALFIGLITFVAGLNILVVLAMTVTDRARDIAVLMSLGAYPNQVRNIFVLQGLTVGVVGTVTGLVAGYTNSWAAGTYRLIPLDPQVYSVPYVPFQANALDGVWIAAVEHHARPTIFHSDNGREYGSKIFTRALADPGIFISRSAKSSPWENGYQESFYSQFKVDLGDCNRFKTLGELIYEIHRLIWDCNHRRIHSALKMPPLLLAERYQKLVEKGS
jgi:hypothetical protein